MKRGAGIYVLASALLLGTLLAPVAAQAAAPPKTLRLDKTSLGGGVAAVTSSPSGISCGEGCTTTSATFAPKTKITLTAVPGTGSSVRSWSSNCAPVPGNANACTITLSADATVTLTLEKTQTLTAAVSTLAAPGEVTGGGIACGSTGTTCTATVAYGTSVTLTAAPTGDNSMLADWNGCDAETATTCTVQMTSARSIDATFGVLAYPLDVTIASTGGGAGSVSGTGTACTSGTCRTMVAPGTSVTLTAAGTPGASRFTGWTDCPSPDGTTCALTMGQAYAVTASFTAIWDLTATATATGGFGGSVACAVGGSPVSCGGPFDHGTVVDVTATPDAGAMFTGWSGACTGSGSCAVTMTADASVTATFAQRTWPLDVTVAKTGAGAGTVSGAGLTCSTGTCSADVAAGTAVTLIATATPGASRFLGWTGCPAPEGTTCSFTMGEAHAITASFTAIWDLTTTASPTDGFGGTIACAVGGSAVDCAGPFDYGTTVVVSATPDTGAMFVGWSGACTGAAACSVSMTSDRSVTATFREFAYVVTIAKTSLGGGTGTITLSDGPLTCGPSCSSLTAYVVPGTQLTLTAEPSVGSSFTGWGGACVAQGTTTTCSLTADGPLSIAATFEMPQLLTAVKAGTGSGTVTGPGIDCGTDCSEYFAYGTSNIVLTATPDPSNGSRITAWSIKTCGTASTCTVQSLTAARTVTVTFALPAVSLTLQKLSVDSGTGSVTSSPTGISCSASCRAQTASFSLTGTVYLTATASSTSYFVRWEGDCSSIDAQNRCVVTGTSRNGDPLTVTAVFGKPVLRLTKTYLTGGTGGVTSSPKGISCSATCTSASATYSPNTYVTLTATASAGTTFGGWSGACTGTGTCTVKMDRAQDVTAVFSKLLTLTVSVGTGGSVASDPVGTIDCAAGSTCTASFAYGTTVTLVATPDADYVFLGWTGSCAYSSTTTCTIAMTDVRNAGASFFYMPPVA